MQAEWHSRRALTSLIALICVAVLLVATEAEAAHACERPSPGIPQAGIDTGENAVRGPCLICASAHSPSLATASLEFLPELNVSQAVPLQPALRRQMLDSFALHVRPPPVF